MNQRNSEAPELVRGIKNLIVNVIFIFNILVMVYMFVQLHLMQWSGFMSFPHCDGHDYNLRSPSNHEGINERSYTYNVLDRVYENLEDSRKSLSMVPVLVVCTVYFSRFHSLEPSACIIHFASISQIIIIIRFKCFTKKSEHAVNVRCNAFHLDFLLDKWY